MKAILVTGPDWSSRTTSDWSDCADRNIWDDLYDMMSAIQEKWKTLEEMLKEIAEITGCSKIESLARLWEAEEVKEATKKFFEEHPLLLRRCRRSREVRCRVRLNTTPLGTATYLYKAKEMKNLARSTKTNTARKGSIKSEQCKHTFEITKAHCAPCAGYNVMDLSGVEELTSKDVSAAENEVLKTGVYSANMKNFFVYSCALAARATGKPIEFFTKMPLKDAAKVRSTVNAASFFE